tara:strand:- start:685 stop:1065 length:381 start_codon:yes stop_codon:yes gene_type:complete
MEKFLNISDVSKRLKLIDPSSKKPLNYIIRYWEKQFRQISPKIINKRRYYSLKQLEIIKLVNYLLKNKGMTIKGVQNILDSNTNKLDVRNLNSLKTDYYKSSIKEKTKKILKKIKKIKSYGKKNSY